MSKTYLKVKIKSLAEEAKIIRLEENKTKANYRRIKAKAIEKNEIEFKEHGDFLLTNNFDNVSYERNRTTFWGLRNHRIFNVRDEARATQLAYAFLRGKTFSYVERNTNLMPYLVYNYKDHKYSPHTLAAYNPFVHFEDRVYSMVKRYGSEEVTLEQIRGWIFGDILNELNNASKAA